MTQDDLAAAGGPGADGGREHMISEAFVALADTLVDDYDVIDLLDNLVGYSMTLLAADAAGLLLVDAHGQLRVVAASSEDAELVELMQVHADEGPCVDCVRTGGPVSVPNLDRAAVRWPAFAAAIARHGAFAAVHALPLRLRGQVIGALNLFHRTPGVLPAADLKLGQALADVATIGILQERAISRSEVVAEQLQISLTNRVIIEQAKGVVAEKSGRDLDAAFALLRGHARSRNQHLAEVARRVVVGALDLVATPAAPG